MDIPYQEIGIGLLLFVLLLAVLYFANPSRENKWKQVTDAIDVERERALVRRLDAAGVM